MDHLLREIDNNLQLVAYRLYTTEITKVQEWITVKLRIVNRQRQRICNRNLYEISYWIGMIYINQ